MPDRERAGRIRQALRAHCIDMLVCALPANVLMMSGYAPVVGTGIAMAIADGPLRLLVPEDEKDLTACGWADEVHTFRPGALDEIEPVEQAVSRPLAAMAGKSSRFRIGFEAGEMSQPVTYSAVHLYGAGMAGLLARCFPNSNVEAADAMLRELRATKTPLEIERLRNACEIARGAFMQRRQSVVVGASEIEVADVFRRPLSLGMIDFPEVQRADGFAWCMSGPNSALAAAAYARSRRKKIDAGDLVLVHCNSWADGYWTDITRTYCAGEPDRCQRKIFDAVFEARDAALAAIRPGVGASTVDDAARGVMRKHGFGAAFKHSTGHGVGFGAISAESLPRLHPRSSDTLGAGMVFNVEPAAYFEGYGGIRHCDVVAVTGNGYQLLTPFQAGACDLKGGA